MDDSPFASPLAMTAIYAAVNALIMVILGMLVVRARFKTQTAIGDGGDPALLGPLRAHGNNAEYVPMAIVLLILLAALRANVMVVHLVGGTLTLGRLLHAFGLTRNVGPSMLRLLGMVFTWLSFIIAIAVLLWLTLVGA